MSRSRRKTPLVPVTVAESDKPFKAAEHRRERRTVRSRLTAGASDDDRRLHAKVYGDPWKAPKDGKHYVPDGDQKLIRK